MTQANELPSSIGLRLRYSGLSALAARLAHHQPLLILVVAMIAGILIDSELCDRWPSLHWTWWVMLAVCGAWLVLDRRPTGRTWVLVSSAMMMSVGGINHRWQDESYQAASLLSLVRVESQPTIFEAVIDSPAILRPHPLAERRAVRGESPWLTEIQAEVTRMQIGTDFRTIQGRVLLLVGDRCDELLPGDAVRVYGSIHRRGDPSNPGQADLRDHDRRNRLHGRVHVDRLEQIVRLPDSQARPIARWIASVANRARDGLLDRLDTTTGPLAVALVIGQRDFVDPETRDLLLVTGTAHLLSVSGMHLAIVVTMATMISTLLRLPPGPKIVLLLAVCLFYTALTGARPPVVRAAVLVTMLMLALVARRPTQLINTLSLAALILILVNPENVFSIGVQLSFLAVITLVLAGGRGRTGSRAVDEAIRQEERLEAMADATRSKPVSAAYVCVDVVKQLLWFSGCVAVISGPLVWHQFHMVSPISVVTNVLLGPFLFVSLASGILTVIGQLTIEPLGGPPAMVCQMSLHAMRWIIERSAQIPGGHFWLPSPPPIWVVLFYVSLAASLMLAKGKRTIQIRIIGIVLWWVVAIGLSTELRQWNSWAGDTNGGASSSELALEVTLVDVGHGTAAIVRFSENDVWLYDCGRLGNETGSSRDIDTALWRLGVTHLRGIVLSHADADHFNSLPGLLRRFRVDQIWTPPGMLDEDEPALDRIRTAILLADVPVRAVSSGDVIAADGTAAMRVLHPPIQRLPGTDNANSLVVWMDAGGRTLVLPGDLEPPGTGVLVNHPRPPPGGILMAPHHGSLNMDAETVLRWARPAEVIVSGGRRADRPEVRRMLAYSGSRVHITHQVGAIRVRIDSSGKIGVRSWKLSPW